MQTFQEAIKQVPDGVVTEISPEDEMHWDGRDEAYFAAGLSALQAIRLAQLTAGNEHVRPRSSDMPSGARAGASGPEGGVSRGGVDRV